MKYHFFKEIIKPHDTGGFAEDIVKYHKFLMPHSKYVSENIGERSHRPPYNLYSFPDLSWDISCELLDYTLLFALISLKWVVDVFSVSAKS